MVAPTDTRSSSLVASLEAVGGPVGCGRRDIADAHVLAIGPVVEDVAAGRSIAGSGGARSNEACRAAGQASGCGEAGWAIAGACEAGSLTSLLCGGVTTAPGGRRVCLNRSRGGVLQRIAGRVACSGGPDSAGARRDSSPIQCRSRPRLSVDSVGLADSPRREHVSTSRRIRCRPPR